MIESEVKMPMCDKLRSVSEESQSIGAFLDWLEEIKEYSIRELRDVEYPSTSIRDMLEDKTWIQKEWLPIEGSIENLLAEYFEIDLVQVDKERSELLNQIRVDGR